MAKKQKRKGLLRFLRATGSLNSGGDPQHFKLARGLVDGRGVEGLPRKEDLPVRDAPQPAADADDAAGTGEATRKPRISRTVLPGAGAVEGGAGLEEGKVIEPGAAEDERGAEVLPPDTDGGGTSEESERDGGAEGACEVEAGQDGGASEEDQDSDEVSEGEASSGLEADDERDAGQRDREG